jgi:hypothetical protein
MARSEARREGEVTNANDIAALVEELSAFTPPSPMNRAAAALASQARRIAELEGALKTIRAWDCLNPPRPDLLGDLPWLRSVVDAALSSGKGETT